MITISELVNKIKRFDTRLFFEWISIIALHPSNQKYLMRLEFLIAVFFSIEKEKFTNEKKSRKDISNIFEELKDEFDSMFRMVEDYVPFEQLKLIPLFLNGNKFYFYYGLIENPYTRLKVLANAILALDVGTHKGLQVVQNQFLISLKKQTEILEELVGCEESKVQGEEVYIPSASFFYKFRKLIRLDDTIETTTCSLGCLHNEQEAMIESCFNFKIPYLFNSSITKIGEYKYNLFPQNHIEYFGYRFKTVINKSNSYQEIWEELETNLKFRLFKLCANMFSIGPSVSSIFTNRKSDDNLLEKYDIACAFLIDQNKLILFKILPHRDNKETPDAASNITKTKKLLKKLVDEILASSEIGIGIYHREKVFGIRSKGLEIWNVLVSEQFSLEMSFYSIKKDSENFHITEIGDLEFVTEQIMFHKDKAGLGYLKFLQNDRHFMNSQYSLIATNYSDRIAMYFTGTEGYFMFGKNPDLMNIVPYQGNEFECEYYFQKYSDSIHDVLEQKFPDKYNVVENLEGNYYRAVDTLELHLLYIVNFKEYPILIYPPKEYSVLPKIDKEFLIQMLPQLVAFYIDEFQDEVVKLLQYSKIYPLEYSIMITSNIALSQEANRLPYLMPIVSKMKDEPFIVETKRLQNGNIRTFIIANTSEQNTLIKLFEPEDNSAEQFVLRSILESILVFSGTRNPEAKSYLFIEKFVPNSKKSFAFNLITSENPKIDTYGSFIEVNDSDIVTINRMFAEYLAGREVKPGVYTGDEAKRINGIIFDYLQILLENTIATFNHRIIFWAYKQLELIEGKRAINRVKIGMKENRILRYNLKEYTQNQFTSLAHLSSYVKHILQTILKVNPAGEKEITKSDWTFLLGIVAALMETNHIYEYIQYDLSPHKLVISELYEIKTEKISDKIDHEKWQGELVDNRIANAQNEYKKSLLQNEENSTNVNEDESSGSTEDEGQYTRELMDLDDIYKKEFGFSLAKKIAILNILYRSNFYSPNLQPLSYVSIKDIEKHINFFSEKDIESDEIELIIDDLSLNYNSYEDKDMMIPTELLRMKNRLNVCPIIKIRNKYLYGNQMCKFSYDLWKNEIIDGDFPYKLDNQKIKIKLDELHTINSKQLETDAKDELTKIFGLRYVVANLKKFQIISKTFPQSPPCGEIDILCVDKNNKIIYVFEAKSILQSNRPYIINLTFRDFFGNKGKRYYQKLNKKYDFVLANIGAFLQYFEIEYSVDWKVHKAFVVDKNVFAAYHTDYNVDFVKVENIKEYIKGYGPTC